MVAESHGAGRCSASSVRRGRPSCRAVRAERARWPAPAPSPSASDVECRSRNASSWSPRVRCRVAQREQRHRGRRHVRPQAPCRACWSCRSSTLRRAAAVHEQRSASANAAGSTGWPCWRSASNASSAPRGRLDPAEGVVNPRPSLDAVVLPVDRRRLERHALRLFERGARRALPAACSTPRAVSAIRPGRGRRS